MVRVEEDYDRKVLFFTLKNSTSLIQHKHINLLQSAIFFLLAQVTVLLYIKWSLIENSFSSCSMEFLITNTQLMMQDYYITITWFKNNNIGHADITSLFLVPCFQSVSQISQFSCHSHNET